MFRRVALVSSNTSVAVRTASTFKVTRSSTELKNQSDNYLDSLPANRRRYDLLGPRSMTHIRLNNQSEKQKKKYLPADDLTGKTALQSIRYIEDPKNWPELNKRDWADDDANAKKMYVQPRGFF